LGLDHGLPRPGEVQVSLSPHFLFLFLFYVL
jgi:hypothetical protein